MSGPALDSSASKGACSVRTVPSSDKQLAYLVQDIGMLIALKSWPELVAIHVRGALNNGLTEVEIREAVLHATIYCGVPAGVEALKSRRRRSTSWWRKVNTRSSWGPSLPSI